jgi:hypothetical protein
LQSKHSTFQGFVAPGNASSVLNLLSLIALIASEGSTALCAQYLQPYPSFTEVYCGENIFLHFKHCDFQGLFPPGYETRVLNPAFIIKATASTSSTLNPEQ